MTKSEIEIIKECLELCSYHTHEQSGGIVVHDCCYFPVIYDEYGHLTQKGHDDTCILNISLKIVEKCLNE
jgi:hypothetical protein